MLLSEIPGQPRAVGALQAALQGGTVHHAYLFRGPSGVGKEDAAKGLAAALTCPVAPKVGCGTCPSCKRVERLSHPDVPVLMPEDELVHRKLAGRADFSQTPSRFIRIEQVRKLQERLALRALEGSRKVVLVLYADRMQDPAQNAFLKTLEEPPPETTLVLVTDKPDRLLPTLRSRLSQSGFAPLPEALIADRVEKERKVDRASAERIAALCGGSLTRALELDAEALELRRATIETFEAACHGPPARILRFSEVHGASREDAEGALQVIAEWSRDVALAKAGSDRFVHRDLADLARAVAARTDVAALHLRGEAIELAFEEMQERNASPRLQLERVLIVSRKGTP